MPPLFETLSIKRIGLAFSAMSNSLFLSFSEIVPEVFSTMKVDSKATV